MEGNKVKIDILTQIEQKTLKNGKKMAYFTHLKYRLPKFMLYLLCNFYALKDMDKILDIKNFLYKILKGYFSLKTIR